MNLSQFFEHWRIIENPFRGEEARHDSVFARLGLADRSALVSESGVRAGPTTVQTGGGSPAAQAPDAASGRLTIPRPFHSDFEKIVGDPARPSTSIVFGEKGSGKTAIRLQLADRISEHNARMPSAKTLLVAYDDLNGVLDRFHRRIGAKTPLESLQKFRLADHMDAILGLVVPRVVDTLLHRPSEPPPAAAQLVDLGNEPRKAARRLDDATKRDLLLLQSIYDRPDAADLRTRRLRSLLRVSLPTAEVVWRSLAWAGWIPAALLLSWHALQPGDKIVWNVSTYGVVALLGVWILVLGKRLLWDRLSMLRLAHKVRKQVRVQSRSDASYARSLGQLDPVVTEPPNVPTVESDEPRYALMQRLQRVLRAFGYAGILVVIDRVDEPTLISGDPEKMRAVIWPMMNNKFLQAEGLGMKMLLPIELRHALFKESSAFFQEARLDKQNLIERLTWTGAMLYDLCDARLKACRDPQADLAVGPGGAPAGPISLMDLFEQDVTAKDVVDALDQMHQPRDAFKFLYACINEHCSNVTAEQGQWKISRATLEFVKKQQSDRVQQLYRGIRPA